MTRKEFSTSGYFKVDPSVVETLMTNHEMTKEQVDAELKLKFEAEYKFYVDQQLNRIISIEC